MRKMTLTQLSPARRRLVEVSVKQAYFGQVQNLIIKDGDPVWEPPPEFFEDYKLGMAKRSQPKALNPNMILSKCWVEFFHRLDELKNGHIARIDMADGEPRKVRTKKHELR